MKYFALILIGILVVSCSNDEIDESQLDIKLLELLDDNSGGEGVNFYTLPSSDDFNSIPQDEDNEITQNKVELGKFLFHETAFAVKGLFPEAKGTYSCASCHHAQAGFQSGIRQGLGEGGNGFGFTGEGRVQNENCGTHDLDVQPVKSPSILNSCYQEVMLWNGQFGARGINEGTEDNWPEGTPIAKNVLGFEGVEIQAIAGMGVHRLDINKELVVENNYKQMFDNAFPNLSEEERYSVEAAGLAIAAYERTVLANQAPFQKYLKGNTAALSIEEKNGAILFFGKANCVACHTGPALNKMEFHALGMNEFNADEVFRYAEDDPARFGRYSFSKKEEDKFKFKTPQLYNLNEVNFYGHGSSFTSIREVIEYKNEAVSQNPEVGDELLAELFVPLDLTTEEINQLTSFITFSLQDPNLDRYVPSSLPSGQCFPNNDPISSIDLGCN